ncbi:MAG TPA: hypothetical protein VGL13_16050 [Polyangiaceae bacterium]|jgi:hypothetical protein
MLLVVASENDETARALESRWSKHRPVRRLTPRDLSTRGWASRFYGEQEYESELVAGGERLLESAIEGVLTRLAAVTPAELPHVARAERPYVASEMTAFLAAWLTHLPCPVVNRPHVLGLSGPAFARAQWLGLAARHDIAISTSSLEVPAASEAPVASSVVVIGDRCFGASSGLVESAALTLARVTGAEVLGLRFNADGALVDQERFPDLASPEMADAVLARFEVRA